ncbi:MAG: PhnD/SsuA/transferrin family substrate-binding protein [Verrucomicrobiae bacterium]|nr:PhnD/SsuA/transferrin family substrate-binding protein [Verrucomicrobiae bacterium]
MTSRWLRLATAAGCLIAGLLRAAAPASQAVPLTVWVMDPLAKELCCACVAGTGQRDYEALGRYLSKSLKRAVKVAFAASEEAVHSATLPRGPEVVIGKESMIAHAVKSRGWPLQPLAQLTDWQGRTTLSGLFVVPTADTAQDLADLENREVWLGPEEETERHAAALDALRGAGIKPGKVARILPSCTTTAQELLDHAGQPAAVGVLSSYALPLLEGCGNIPPRSLRVVGRTAPVPFITVFIHRELEPSLTEALGKALEAVAGDRKLCQRLESRDGFVPYEDVSQALQEWPGWGGALRRGLTARLPAALPQPLPVLWERKLNHAGLGGVAAAEGYVVVSDRDPLDEADLWRCFRAETGEVVWTLAQRTRGPRLDYGNSPRATPLLARGRAYLLGAYGDLLAVELASGKILWKRHLVKDFQGRMPHWGYANSPLLFENRLWVLPGGTKNFLVGLDPASGKLLCSGAGSGQPGYAALVAGEWHGQSQVVAYEEKSLGGWETQSGRRLWKLTPPEEGDFNVPTPVPLGDGLVLATENNGCRWHRFDRRGRLNPQPIGVAQNLRPVTATPVVAGQRLVGNSDGLLGLEWRTDLKQWVTLWKKEEEAWGEHVSFITDGERVLCLGYHGDLLLLDATAPDFRPLSQQRLFEEDAELYAFPAVARGRLYVRGPKVLRCLGLGK